MTSERLLAVPRATPDFDGLVTRPARQLVFKRRESPDSSSVSQQSSFTSSISVPNPDGVVSSHPTAHQFVSPDRQRQHLCIRSLQGLETSPVSHVPNFHFFVIRRTRQLAVPARNRVHPASVLAERLQAAACSHIPQFDRLVIGPADQSPIPHGQRPHRIIVTSERLLAGPRTAPDFDGLVIRPTRQLVFNDVIELPNLTIEFSRQSDPNLYPIPNTFFVFRPMNFSISVKLSLTEIMYKYSFF